MELTSRDKAAVLMIALGKEYSAKIYKHLNDEEIEQLTLSITGLSGVDTEMTEEVLDEFHDICVAQKYITEGGIDYARDVLVKAMGEEKADALLSRLSASLQVKPFDFVRRADSAQVLSFIQNEHPQTIALILSYLAPEQAASVLSSLNPEVQARVVERIATMTMVSPDYIREAERILEHKLSSVDLAENMSVGGVDTIVEILNSVDRSTEKGIMDSIEQDDPELAEEIRKKMFVFEDIVKLANLDMQRVIKEVDNDVLTIALKGASDEIAKKIYENISNRLQEMIKENMEYMGPVRVRDVEEAQQKIVGIIRRLEDAGEIQVSRGGADDALIV